jgi:hypothetical protein
MMCIEIILIAAPTAAAVRNEVSKMRQISVFLATAAITATVAVAGVGGQSQFYVARRGCAYLYPY